MEQTHNPQTTPISKFAILTLHNSIFLSYFILSELLAHTGKICLYYYLLHVCHYVCHYVDQLIQGSFVVNLKDL